MRTFIKKTGKAIAFITFVSAIFVTKASAATFTVNLTHDAGDLTCDATCTLRDAVDDANNLVGADTIVFDAGIFGTPQTISLSGSDIALSSDVTITGPGANLLTVSGNNASKIFSIPETPTVTISGMTLTQGDGTGTASGFGGAVYNQGTLTLNNMVVTGNTVTGDGGGIYVSTTGDTLNINNSVISNNIATSDGGGVYADDGSIFTVTNSTFSGNTAQTTAAGGGGGGIYLDTAAFNMTDSTVSGNTASGSNGGGIAADVGSGITITRSTVSGNFSDNDGGGMWIQSGTGSDFNMSNSTISGNQITGATGTRNGGGIFRSGATGTFIVIYSTIVNNSAATDGGGVNAPTADIGGTIIANNTDAGTAPDFFGTLNSQGYNLIENTTGTTITGTTTGNITGQDPVLNVLGNYGGPTQTHPLMVGSPAIDAANPMSFPATDQRGVMRPVDGNGVGGAQPDIGAFEVAQVTAAGVTVAGRVSDGLRGIAKARVVMTDSLGIIRTAQTNPFGYFRFEEVPAGQTYVVEVFSKQYQFNPQVIFVSEDISDLNFMAELNTSIKR